MREGEREEMNGTVTQVEEKEDPALLVSARKKKKKTRWPIDQPSGVQTATRGGGVGGQRVQQRGKEVRGRELGFTHRWLFPASSPASASSSFPRKYTEEHIKCGSSTHAH